MSLLTIINGIVIGCLLLSAIFSFVLVIRRFEVKINLYYILFSVSLSLYVFFSLLFNFIQDYHEFIFYDKILTACITIAGVFFIYLVAHLTNYIPKKFLLFLASIIFVQLVLNSVIQNGITFSQVTGRKELILLWGETIYYPAATISAFLFFQIFLLIVVFGFVLSAIYHMYKTGNKENWKILLCSLSVALTLVLLNTLFEFLRFRGLIIFEKLGFLSFTIIVVHRNFKNLFMAGQLRSELVKSEERLRLVLESTSDGIWDINVVSNESYLSPRYAEMLGYKTEELLNKTIKWEDLIHPDDNENVKLHLNDFLCNRVPSFNRSYRMRMKDGNWKWIYARGRVVEFINNNKPLRIVGTHTDIDELMKVQMLLEESQRRYKYLAESTFEGIGITENGILTDCNDTLCKMVGYTAEELIGKDFMDLVAPDSKDVVTNLVKKQNLADHYDHLIIRKDGSIFPVEVRVNTLEIDGRRLRLTAIRDMSLQLEYEKEILSRENTLRNIIDSAPFGAQTYKVNDKGVLTLVGYNKYADSTLNINHSKLIGKTITEAFPSLGITQVPTIYKKVATEGINYKDDQTLYNGSTIIGIFEVNAIRTAKNQVTVFFRDVTEKKRSEENLRANEEKYRLIAENSTDMIAKHDSKGNFIYVSPASKNLLGYDPSELVGKNPFEYFHSDDIPVVTESLNKILNDHAKIDVTVYRFKGKNGKYVWLETTSKTICNHQTGVIREIHTTSRDVGERIRYQQELKNNADNLNRIFDATPIPLILESLSPKVQVIYANDAACKFIGKEKNEILGKMVVGGIPNRMNGDSGKSFLKEGDAYDFETSMLINGEVRYATVNIRIVKYNGSDCALSAIHDITERKLALDANEASERKLSTAMTIARLGHWEYDIFLKQFTFNDEFYKMLRTTVKEIGSYTLSESEYAERFIPAEERNIVAEEINKAIQTNDSNYINQIEHHAIFGDGTTGYLTARINVVKDDEGQTVKIYGVDQDITENKIAEEENTRRKYLIDQLLENVPDIIYFKDIESRFLEISKSFSNRLQIRSREEIIGKTDSDIFDKDHADEAYADEQHIMQTGTPLISKIEKELWYGKEEHWALTTKMPLKNSKGEIIGTFGISRDITESKKAEEELRAAMHYIEYVINSIPVAILSVDDENNVTQFNQAAKKFLNATVSENERGLFEKFPELKMVDEFLKKSRIQKSLVTDVKTVADDEGEAKLFSISIFPLATTVNPGSVIMVEEITNRRKMEQVLIQSEKMLSVAGLAAGMAHEINNPLGTISQGCQNLVRRTSTILPKNFEVAKRLGIEMEKVESYFKERQLFDIMDSMQGAVEKASDIIKNMLQFSRMSESKKIQYSLKKIIEEVIDLAYNDYDLKKKFNFRSFRIIKEYEELIPDVLITVTELQQVVYNIIQNAAHAIRTEENPEKLPTLTFRLLKEPRFVKLEIEDNGPGIKEKIKNRIFEPFFTTKEVGEGTGLGLSVSYMIITHNHNGLLTVESVPGRGTKFIIQLPFLDKT